MSETVANPSTVPPAVEHRPEPPVPTIASGADAGREAPRLAAGPLPTPTDAPAPAGSGINLPRVTAHESSHVPALPGGAPTLPAAAPLPTATPTDPRNAAERFDQHHMPIDTAALPTLPDAPAVPNRPTAAAETAETAVAPQPAAGAAPGEHRTAHPRPVTSKPNEASKRAAEIRAAKKKKSKRIKLAALVAALVLSALAGPPFVSWVTDAVNEAGAEGAETRD